MVTIDSDVLPVPSSCDQAEAVVRQVTSNWQSGAPLRIHVPDKDNDRRTFQLNYVNKPREVIAAVRAHYRSTIGRAFEWTPPGESTALLVMHSEPPSISWGNRAGTCRAFLEEAMGY